MTANRKDSEASTLGNVSRYVVKSECNQEKGDDECRGLLLDTPPMTADEVVSRWMTLVLSAPLNAGKCPVCGYSTSSDYNAGGSLHIYASKQNEKWPEKDIARRQLRLAVRCNRVKKTACEDCGYKIVEAHHYLGYSEEHWFDVKWLCRHHHRIQHGFIVEVEKWATS